MSISAWEKTLRALTSEASAQLRALENCEIDRDHRACTRAPYQRAGAQTTSFGTCPTETPNDLRAREVQRVTDTKSTREQRKEEEAAQPQPCTSQRSSTKTRAGASDSSPSPMSTCEFPCCLACPLLFLEKVAHRDGREACLANAV
jgi:hypothetical protein